MSTFNAEQFLSTRQTGALDTKYPVVPASTYKAQVESLKARQQEIKKGDRKGEISTIMDINWEILDDRLKEKLEMRKILVRQSIFLDMTEDDPPQIDYGKGKNIKLGRLRETFHQNDPKRDWFPNMLIGQMGNISVEHQPNEDDPDSPYARVVDVTAL